MLLFPNYPPNIIRIITIIALQVIRNHEATPKNNTRAKFPKLGSVRVLFLRHHLQGWLDIKNHPRPLKGLKKGCGFLGFSKISLKCGFLFFPPSDPPKTGIPQNRDPQNPGFPKTRGPQTRAPSSGDIRRYTVLLVQNRQ